MMCFTLFTFFTPFTRHLFCCFTFSPVPPFFTLTICTSWLQGVRIYIASTALHNELDGSTQRGSMFTFHISPLHLFTLSHLFHLFHPFLRSSIVNTYSAVSPSSPFSLFRSFHFFTDCRQLDQDPQSTTHIQSQHGSGDASRFWVTHGRHREITSATHDPPTVARWILSCTKIAGATWTP